MLKRFDLPHEFGYLAPHWRRQYLPGLNDPVRVNEEAAQSLFPNPKSND
jgi:hypothetical protein